MSKLRDKHLKSIFITTGGRPENIRAAEKATKITLGFAKGFAEWLTDFKGKTEPRFIAQVSDEPCFMESRLHTEQGYPPAFYTTEELLTKYIQTL